MSRSGQTGPPGTYHFPWGISISLGGIIVHARGVTLIKSRCEVKEGVSGRRCEVKEKEGVR